MSISNRIENGIIAGATAIVTAVLVVFVIHFVSIKPLERIIDKQTAVIVELAKIEKYKIENDFEKMRTKGNGQIVLDLNNSLNALELENMPLDSLAIELPKKTFFQKLKFWKNDKK